MPNTNLPLLELSPELQRDVQAVLQPGEDLGAFVVAAVGARVAARRKRRDFIARAAAAGQRAQKTGRYIPAGEVVARIESMLATAVQQLGKR
jgi:hypothetical protein